MLKKCFFENKTIGLGMSHPNSVAMELSLLCSAVYPCSSSYVALARCEGDRLHLTLAHALQWWKTFDKEFEIRMMSASLIFVGNFRPVWIELMYCLCQEKYFRNENTT